MFYTSAHLQECKDRKNKWRGVLKYKDPETQVWHEKKKTFKGVRYKRDALVELGKWRDEMEAKAPIREYEKSVDKAITDYLDTQYRLNQIAVSTYQDMTRMNRSVIKPRIGKYPFADLTRSDLQRFVNDLAKLYEPATVRRYFAIVSKTYKHALRQEEVLKDPTNGVSLPRIIKKPINYLDADGRRKFLSVMNRESQFYLPSMIAYYTGMRTGEICALQWKDIKLPLGVITIRQTAIYHKDPEHGNKHRVMIGTPKTPKSKRTIPIAEQLVPILEREAQERKPKADDYVIEQRNPKLLCTSFLKWAGRNEVYGTTTKPISMHGLRHTFATLGVQSGMDIKSLSSILGHANAAMTLDIYASDDESAKRLAMQNLSSFFRQDSENEL